MRRSVLLGVMVLCLCDVAVAQQWIPPRPGQDTCSGWVDEVAREKCRETDASQQRSDQARRAAEEARTRAIQQAETARIRAEHEAADQARRQAATAAAAQRQADEDAAVQSRARAEAKATAEAAADAADPFKRVDSLDLQVSPEDFVGRRIKVFGFQCYAPSPNGRRCISAENVVLLQPEAIEPVEVRSLLDHECSSFRVAMIDASCRWTARFVLDDIKVERTDDGDRRVVLLPREAELSQQ